MNYSDPLEQPARQTKREREGVGEKENERDKIKI